VVLFGTATLVESPEEKTEALRAISEQIVPGRWDEVRWPTEQELKATKVLALPISEASAKVRTGPPLDDEEDYELKVWAGLLPFHVETEEPVADPRLNSESQEVPAYLLDYSKRPI
jgi:uncharacterized protein